MNTNVPRLKSESRAPFLLRLALMRNVVFMEVSLLFDNMTCVFILLHKFLCFSKIFALYHYKTS